MTVIDRRWIALAVSVLLVWAVYRAMGEWFDRKGE